MGVGEAMGKYKLDGGQRKLLGEILTEAGKIKDPKERAVFERAATQTAIVESGIRNLSGGDADSAGWRQERASLYPDPTNVRNSARRFRQEFQRAYRPGMKSYDLAAVIQRPAAQYRGRYKERAKDAEAALAQLDSATKTSSTTSSQPRTLLPATPARTTAPKVDVQGALVDSMLGGRRKGESLLSAASRAIDSGEYTTPGETVPGSPAVRLPAAADSGSGTPAGATGDSRFDKIVREADRVDKAKVPYLWGGGHNARQIRGSKVTPLDCSGAVSRILGVNPMVSGEFAKWGAPGAGKKLTIYANGEHVLVYVKGRGFWGTSKANPGGGAGWIPREKISAAYLSKFTKRHPPGL